ncbi:basic secretory family protein [Actinomadura sp. ATCC 31491]|uniref:Basic secretory family protein n=1 Tax=Actinomadura luzonensis TaxID=2805427 RepID=A0ABT0G9B6_9ACTN|nr:basic secretory family protein [Actinomadura luzonensis]MCK2220708.1 basic secretory family protein [Actinomadura luzonensis]
MSEQVSRRAATGALLLLALVPAASAAVPRALWPGETVTARGARSVVVGHGTPAATLAELARRADTAALRVADVLGEPVRPLVVVPASAAEAARLVGAGPVAGLAALADGDRVIVVPDAFARLNPTGRDVVLTHELTHVAAGTDRLPPWLYEGFADYVGYRDAGLPVPVAAAELAGEVRAGRLPGELPGPAAFAADGRDPARLARAYQEAWLACRFLADRFSEGTLVRLYRAAQATGVERALAPLGLSVATLTARWRGYVREQLG